MPNVPPSSATSRGFHRRIRSRAAFTLVEVMIAFTIMVSVLCGGLTAMQSGFKAIDTARCSTLAAQIMQSQIENLRLQNWDKITDPRPEVGSLGTRDITVSTLIPTSASDIAGRFTLTQTVEKVAPRDELLDIRLSVSWSSMGQVTHTRTFTTRYSKNGLNDFYISSH